MVQFDWQVIVYVGSVQLVMLASIVVLYRLRHRAPRACWLGVVAYSGLLLFNTLALWAGPLIVHHVQTGEVLASLVWQWQFLTLLSAVTQVFTYSVLTLAILTERKPEGADEPDGGS